MRCGIAAMPASLSMKGRLWILAEPQLGSTMRPCPLCLKRGGSLHEPNLGGAAAVRRRSPRFPNRLFARIARVVLAVGRHGSAPHEVSVQSNCGKFLTKPSAAPAARNSQESPSPQP